MRRWLLFFFLLSPQLFGQNPSPNVRIYPSAVTQTEPTLSFSPINPNLLFASAVTINTATGFKSEGVYISTNGGASWTGSDTCRGELLANHGGDPTTFIHPGGRIVLSHIGLVFPGVYSHYSADLGITWSAAATISSQQAEDKGRGTMDDHPQSQFYGRMYMSWVSLVVPYPLSFSYSTNAGTSWSSQAAVNPSPPSRCSGGSTAVANNGDLFVTWAGVASTAPFREDFAGFARSTDGGNTWSATQNIFDMNGIAGTLPAKSNIRVNGLPKISIDNSGGARNGWLYIVSAEQNLAPAGTDPDIVLHRSSNGGVTWSAGIRVNQDPQNNGKIQYFPAMDVDSAGGINIIYCDDRSTTSDSAEIVLARSVDGGSTWTETVMSDHRFKPKPIVGGASSYQGDHIELKAIGSKLHALWMDDATGLYQIWHCVVDLLDTSAPEEEIPFLFSLHQNYPNPFNPSTRIEYTLQAGGHTVLEVFDINGRLVRTLVNERKASGIHMVEFQAGGLSSGTYSYRLRVGGRSAVRTMVLVR